MQVMIRNAAFVALGVALSWAWRKWRGRGSMNLERAVRDLAPHLRQPDDPGMSTD